MNIEIDFSAARKEFKLGEHKLSRRSYFGQEYMIMRRTWYGWKVVSLLVDKEAAELELKERNRLWTIRRNFL